MDKGDTRCMKCEGFGAYQDCISGRVQRVCCDCETGKRFKERTAKDTKESEQ